MIQAILVEKSSKSNLSRVEGSEALYLYSNIQEKFNPSFYEDETPFSTNSDIEFSKADRIKELWNSIEKKGLEKGSFGIPPLDASSITVFVSDSLRNFYVNLRENREYFTVRINPTGQDGTYVFNDVDSWKRVITYFDEWLDLVDDQPSNAEVLKSFNKAKGVRFLEGATAFSFRNEKIKAVLNVETQAQIFFVCLTVFHSLRTGFSWAFLENGDAVKPTFGSI